MNDGSSDATVTVHQPAARIERTGAAGFLLCRPSFFDVEYAINPFMEIGVSVDRGLAMHQWERFRDALIDHGAEVHVQEGVPGYPDLVFTNNAGVVCGNQALLARFRYPQRQGEAAIDKETFEALGFEVIELPHDVVSFEGAADAVPFNGRVVCGHGPRSDERVVEHVEALMGLPALSVPLVDERLYHLDLGFCRLDEQTAIVSEIATTPSVFAQLLELVPQAVVLDAAETLAFCANSAVVGSTIFMHEVPARVGAALEAFGFEAVAMPVGEFLKAGGSLGCMSLRLY